MNQNILKLNDGKTELIVFTSQYKHDLYNDLRITIGGTVVDCSSQVKDLGVIFDRVLSPRQHVSYTSKVCRFHLRNISGIMKYIPQGISIIIIINNNICLKSNIQTSSVDCAPRELTHACMSIVRIKSLVMSRLDYSNGLLYGLPKCTVSGL